ncbi:alpha/beta-hydrolase [Polychaeton citri CBS 116435]|uniref:Alpha/beta-hydrolase n=1 Tax=Polychaeton citri CBS 116435 TaxID=1314669 RepID=A0A9P4UJA9_9PEZI|nr:alpha/beta-hydrolase [Polychaeton citri CBS 116435]
MLDIVSCLGIVGCFISISSGAPAPAPVEHEKRDAYGDALSSLTAIRPTATPADVSAASAALSSIINATPTPANLFETAGNIAKAGLSSDTPADLLGFVNGVLTGQNSEINVNLRIPAITVYPKAGSSDAPYSLTEAQLRAAIYIPPTFKYGKGVQPVILVPGTGDTGYTTFIGNYIPLLQGSNIGDPVWLNIPGYLLGDAQINAEYVAYAINYIYGISGKRNVAVLAWSQGNIDAQWAYKYWPSTRSKVTDQIAFSPDYHGTVVADLASLPGEPLPPSLLQQRYNSQFITTLRSNGGDSAYVPTTNIYSGFFDEIVQPQSGTGASAFLKDARNVGVTNNEVQSICTGQAAGSFYTHEGTLYNPLGFALAVDALTHAGPGSASRVRLSTVCNDYITLGLDLGDFLLTENTVLIAGISILAYPFKVFNEPAIKSYAR